MESTITRHEAVNHEDLLVHTWRVSRLVSLGIPEPLAQVYAGHIDWHQIAARADASSGTFSQEMPRAAGGRGERRAGPSGSRDRSPSAPDHEGTQI